VARNSSVGFENWTVASIHPVEEEASRFSFIDGLVLWSLGPGLGRFQG